MKTATVKTMKLMETVEMATLRKTRFDCVLNGDITEKRKEKNVIEESKNGKVLLLKWQLVNHYYPILHF